MNPKADTKYDFTLIAAGLTDARQVPESVFEAGCDDCSISSSEGRVRIDFHREAATLVEAVGSAIIDLKKAGVSAWLESVEPPADTVDAA